MMIHDASVLRGLTPVMAAESSDVIANLGRVSASATWPASMTPRLALSSPLQSRIEDLGAV